MSLNRKSSSAARVIILSGPSGAGKTTLHDLLLKDPSFKGKIVRSVSATTRRPRGQEKPGKDYFFLTQKMFERKIGAGQFLEWARVFDHYYGTPMKPVLDNLKQGRSVLLCIDVQGGLLVKKKVKDALMVFIKTPSLKELKVRLLSRGTDTKDAVALRLKTAASELKEAGKYDRIIVNDDLKKAYRQLGDFLIQELALS